MNNSNPVIPSEYLDETEEAGFDMFSFEDPFFSMIDVPSGNRVAFRLSQLLSIARIQGAVRVCIDIDGAEWITISPDTGNFLEGLLAAYVGFIDLDKKTAITLEQ